MKKIIGLILMMMTSSAFAFPETFMKCTLPVEDEQVSITISKDDHPTDEFGSLFAVAESDKSEYKTELFSRLKWQDYSSRYMPELFKITGNGFNIFNEFDGRVYFSGILFNQEFIHKRIHCD